MKYRNRRCTIEEPVPDCRDKHHRRAKQNSPIHAPAAFERAAQLFRAMGDQPRLRILEMLSSREFCVTEIVEALAEKFSTVSQRLRLLRTEGLIARRRKGTHIYYALADRHVADLIQNALAHAAELEATPAALKEGD
jgi:ArsR family transcriptional regulator